MRLVIIESPYKGENLGDLERNKRYLRSCIRDCINRGESPYASHRMLTDALDDNDPVERAVGIKAGLAWRQACVLDGSRLVVASRVLPIFYVDLGWSNGMKYARDAYDKDGIGYEERTLPPNDPFFAPVEATPILTEDELVALSVFAPNLACVIAREPPRAREETRKRAREELAALLRMVRSKPKESERDIDIDDGC